MHGRGAERQGFDHVRPSADAAVDHHRHAAVNRSDNLRQNLDGSRERVQASPAVVGNNDAIRASGDAGQSVFSAHDTLKQQGYVGDGAQPLDVLPSQIGRNHLVQRLDGGRLPHSGKVGIGDAGWNFQNLALFKGMSVIDNLMTGRNLRIRSNLLLQALRIGPAEREEIRHREFVEHIIDFLEIQAHRKTAVGQLPYGLQKRVDLGRALAMEPQVLLLDEPMAGMNLEEKQDMSRFVLDINDEFGTTVVLIEHDMGVVMDISDRVVVLDYGKKIGDGTPEEVRNNPAVISAYLGTTH